MPDTNLGTAHGSIKITYDSRGAQQGLAQLAKMQKQFEQMNTRLAAVQKSLTATEQAIQSSANQMDRLTRTMQNSNRYTGSFSKNFRNMRRDISQTTAEVVALSNAIGKLSQYKRPLEDLSKFLNGFAAGGQGLRGFARGLGDIDARSRFLPVLAASLLGVNRAMKDMPRWSQETLRYASYLKLLGPAAAIASAHLSGPLAKAALGLNRVFALAGAGALALSANLRRFDRLRIFANGIDRATAGIARFASSSGTFGRSIRVITQNFANLPRHVTAFIGGLALIKSGINGLGRNLFISQFARTFAKLPVWAKAGAAALAIFGSAAIEAFGKALSGVSNLVAGLVAGVKQIAGGFLALPAAFSVVAASVGVLTLGLSGLKDQFKDLGKGGQDGLKALLSLPDRLRPLGNAIYDVLPKLKEFRDSIQDILLAGADKQLYGLVDFANALSSSMKGTATALRGVKDQFLGFAADSRTVSDLNGLFNRTAQILNTLGAAVKPFFSGLRDIGVSGLPFIQELASQFQFLTTKFQAWAQVNRESGQFLKWMQDGYKGVRDLISGTIELSKALFALLTMFQTRNEDNFLNNYAKSMKKFNDTVQKSVAVGTLHDISQAIKNLGTDKIENAKNLIKFLGQAFADIYPTVRAFSNAFMQIIIPAIKQAVREFQFFANVLHSLALDKVIGWALGLYVAFRFLPTIFGPIINGIRLMWGAFLVLNNGPKIARAFEGAILAVGAALENMGSVGRKAGGALINVTSGLSGFISSAASMAGPIAIAVAAIGALILIWKTASDDAKEFDKQLKSNQDTLDGFSKKLRDAFIEDRAVVGKNVIRQLNENVQSEMAQLEQTAQKAPGVMDHIWSFLKGSKINEDLAHSTFGETDDTNRWQKQAADAQRASDGLKKLVASGRDVGKMLAESDDAWNADKDAIAAWSENGAETNAVLQQMRDQLKQTEANAKALGPAGADVAAGLKKIADAGNDATSKLEGLEQVLKGLGILKTDQLQAAAEYAESIRKLGENAANAVSGVTDLDKILNNGKIDVTTQAGKALLDLMVPLAQEFKTLAANGGDVDQKFADLQPQLDGIAQQFGITKEQLLSFLRDLGVAPKEVKIALALAGKDNVAQDMGHVLEQMQSIANGGVNVPVAITTNANDISQKINQILGRDATSASGTNLFIKPDVRPEDLTKIANELAKYGIIIPGMQTPGAAQGGATVPVTPTTKAPNQPQNGQNDPNQGFKDLFGPILDNAAGAAKTGGAAFSDNFAQGILDGKGKVDDAAKQVAAAAADHMPHSPAKKGPLSGQGWSGYSGRAFTSDFATGISANEGQVTQAAGGVAGAAAGALPPGLGGQAPGTKAGAFLGQISQLVNFFSHFSDVAQKIADTALKIAKFASDPLGKGTFFGQSLGWKRTASDAELKKRQGDFLQNKALGVFDSPTVSDQYDPKTGFNKIPTGMLQRDASKADVIREMVARGQAAGLTEPQIKAMIATAGNETGGKFDNPVGRGQGAFLPGGGKGDAYGLFQQTEGWGTVEQRLDPNYAINKFIEAYQGVLSKNPGIDPLTAATLTQNPQLGSGAAGSDYQNTTKRYMDQAAKDYAEAVTNPVNKPTIASGGTSTGTYGMPAGQTFTGTDFPQWVQDLGAKFGLFPKTYPGHQENGQGGHIPSGDVTPNPQGLNRGIDWWPLDANGKPVIDMSGKSYTPEMASRLTAFSKFLQENGLAEQVINQNPITGEKVGFPLNADFSGDYGGHAGHSHTRFSRPVVLNGSRTENSYGPPLLPGQKPSQPDVNVQQNPDGTYSLVTPHTGDAKMPGPINPQTQQPWTEEEAKDFYSKYLQYNANGLTPEQLQQIQNTPGVFAGSTQDLINSTGNPNLQTALGLKDTTNATDQQVLESLNTIQKEIDKQNTIDTPESRALVKSLQSTQSTIAQQYGFEQEQNPIDTASSVIGSMGSAASDIFGAIQAGIESVGSAKDIADTLVRGVSNTEDIFNMVDKVQTFITFASKIAGAVQGVAGAIGAVAGAAGGSDPTGGASGAATAIQGVSAIAGIVQSALDTANAIIDLGQEAYRIVGSYVGDFLGYLAGGSGGQLMGNVKFLLDQTTGQLLTYSADNPLDKRAHNLPGQSVNTDARNQGIGQINVYGGPGSDPRDDTRNMMFQVRVAQYSGALAS